MVGAPLATLQSRGSTVWLRFFRGGRGGATRGSRTSPLKDLAGRRWGMPWALLRGLSLPVPRRRHRPVGRLRVEVHRVAEPPLSVQVSAPLRVRAAVVPRLRCRPSVPDRPTRRLVAVDERHRLRQRKTGPIANHTRVRPVAREVRGLRVEQTLGRSPRRRGSVPPRQRFGQGARPGAARRRSLAAFPRCSKAGTGFPQRCNPRLHATACRRRSWHLSK